MPKTRNPGPPGLDLTTQQALAAPGGPGDGPGGGPALEDPFRGPDDTGGEPEPVEDNLTGQPDNAEPEEEPGAGTADLDDDLDLDSDLDTDLDTEPGTDTGMAPGETGMATQDAPPAATREPPRKPARTREAKRIDRARRLKRDTLARLAGDSARTAPPSPMSQNEPHFPKPTCFHFTEGNEVGKRPEHFLNYWAKLAKDDRFKDRIVVYVYRMFPVMKAEHRLVQKLYGDPIELDDLQSRYGCGDYHLKINDMRYGYKCAAMATVKGFRDWNHYPPILDLDYVDWTDPYNATYKEQLRSRGTPIPGEPEYKRGDKAEEQNMANVQAITEMTGLVKDLVMDKRQQAPPPPPPPRDITGDATAKALEIVQEGSRGAMGMITGALSKVNELQSKSADPMAVLEKAMGFAETIIKSRHEGEGGKKENIGETLITLTNLLQGREEQYSSKLFNMQQTTIARMEEEIRALRTTQQQPPPGVVNPAAPPKTFMEQLKEMKEQRSLIRDVFGLKPEEADEDKDSTPGWVTALPTILQAVTVLGSVIVSGLHNLAVARTGQGVPVAAPSPNAILTPEQLAAVQQGGQTVPMPGAYQPGSPIHPPQPAAAAGEETASLQDFYAFFRKVETPLLRVFNEGGTGVDFAEVLVELGDNGFFNTIENGQRVNVPGHAVYDMVTQYPMALVDTAIKSYQPIGSVIKLTPQKWDKFLAEFYSAAKVWEKEDQQDRGGGAIPTEAQPV